jgi:DNA-binding transcriptional regulator YhcF (GntR family)
VDDGLVETRRGLGMFVNPGARKLLLQGERQKFLAEDWPRIHSTIQRLGLNAKNLLNGANHQAPSDPAPQDAAQQETADSNPLGSNPTKKEER